MYLFLILLFPIGFSIWCRAAGIERLPKYLIAAFMGLFSAAVFCAYKFFFSPFYHLTQDSFFLNFLYFFLNQVFVPLLVLTIIFLFFSTNNYGKERFGNIFPFYVGFYGVYIPFVILCGTSPISFFLLFTKPLIYFFMVLSLSKILAAIFEKEALSTVGKKSIFLYGFFLVIFAPPVIESLWLVGFPVVLLFVASVAYMAFCAMIAVVKR